MEYKAALPWGIWDKYRGGVLNQAFLLLKCELGSTSCETNFYSEDLSDLDKCKNLQTICVLIFISKLYCI